MYGNSKKHRVARTRWSTFCFGNKFNRRLASKQVRQQNNKTLREGKYEHIY